MVPQKDKKDQEPQLTIIDLENAIKGMNNSRSPGEDGIPIDFYKVFWKYLKVPYYHMMIE